VLARVANDVVDLSEVKAANKLDDDHIADVAFQLHVLEAAGLTVRSASLMHFDEDFVYGGGSDYADIFKTEDVTQKARKWEREKLPRHLDAMRRDVAAAQPPRIRVKNGCKDCSYYRQVCSLDAPARPVCELGGNHPKLYRALEEAGIESLGDVPADFPGLAPEHLLVLLAVEKEALALNHGLCRELESRAEFPLWFVDFETYSTGFPPFEGTRPWQQIPFQWSLHVLDDPDAEPRHEEFLVPDANDPRRRFAESLLAAIGDVGSIVVYSQAMESSRLKELARDFPELADGLYGLRARVLDLLPFVRQTCYHPSMAGSRSLKKVTPVLAPHLSYDDLDVHAGMQAMEAYETTIDPGTSEEERERLRSGLRAYCGVDTLAMVEVFRRLVREGQAD
jgi:hypothetical protein